MSRRLLHCLAALLVGACNPVQYAPPSLVDGLRVLGARAEPPALVAGTDSDLELLVAGQAPDAELCHAWAFCPFAWSKDGRFQCIDPDLQIDLGTAATATVGPLQVFQALAAAPAVFEKLGLPFPGAGGDGQGGPGQPGGGGGLQASQIPEPYVLFQVAEAGLLGGTCPTDAATLLATPCTDRDRCMMGYKRLELHLFDEVSECAPFDPSAEPTPCASEGLVCGCDGVTYVSDCARIAAGVSRRSQGVCPNRNPRVLGVELQGVPWPEGVTPSVRPDVGVALAPVLDPANEEISGVFEDPVLAAEGPDRETVVVSWFSTAGDYGKQRTLQENPANVFRAPILDPGEPERLVTLWLVLHDGRNGTDWTSRQVRVRADAPKGIPVLCAIDPSQEGCETP